MRKDIDVEELFQKAQESLKASKLLFKEGFYDFAVSRAYYTMFYLAEAVLLTKGLSLSKHKAVISAFGEHFAKTKLLPLHLHRYLIDAYDIRQKGDYEADTSITHEKTEEVIKWADEFIEEVRNFLKKEGYQIRG